MAKKMAQSSRGLWLLALLVGAMISYSEVIPEASEMLKVMPLWSSCSGCVVDQAIYYPWQRVVRLCKAGLRGFWHASRDLLFPAYREQGGLSSPFGTLDSILPDEGTLEFQNRLLWRRTLLGTADSMNLPQLYALYPEYVRLGFAVVVGLALLLILTMMRKLAEACARTIVRLAYREVDEEQGEGSTPDRATTQVIPVEKGASNAAVSPTSDGLRQRKHASAALKS